MVAPECVVPWPLGVYKVQGVSACGPSTLCRCVPRCLLPYVFDSAGSAGVIFGLTRVVVKAFLCSAIL
ncbi:hypothetical protein Taro_029385 [Colocasia esculenta]|uniref:Uncharacterized protein n=1 Tax=Colocasia esculenta TaxID=4460 RepID=A0A843VIU2_COLES|nr:hypothetical protein [Colocasia esculenta]